MLKYVGNVALFLTALLWMLSWTNLLHPTYNWWGLIFWAGETFG